MLMAGNRFRERLNLAEWHNRQIELREDLRGCLPKGDPFEQVMALRGERIRERPDRVTMKCAIGGKAFFVKLHFGIGWREILKNLLSLHVPTTSAMHEWRAIERLGAIGIRTAEAVGAGERGWNPARRRSFLITDALPETVTLEQLTREWQRQPPSFDFRYRLIRKVAEIARTLHKNGINHRDLYLCHFRLPRAYLEAPENEDPPLFLMDLHRAQIRKRLPRRWLLKDLGALYFSSACMGLTRRDQWRFIRYYEQRSLRSALRSHGRFWQKVQKRGERFLRKIRD